MCDRLTLLIHYQKSPYTITSLVDWTAYHVEVQTRNSLQPLATHW